MSGEIQWSAGVLRALDSIRHKLSRGTSARETEAARVLNDCLSRMREGKSIHTCVRDNPGLCQLLEVILTTAESVPDALGDSPSDQSSVRSTFRLGGMLEEREQGGRESVMQAEDCVRLNSWAMP